MKITAASVRSFDASSEISGTSKSNASSAKVLPEDSYALPPPDRGFWGGLLAGSPGINGPDGDERHINGPDGDELNINGPDGDERF